MKRPSFLLLSACIAALTIGINHASAQDQPNIILIFTDDQGYGDVGCYGAKGFKTPNMDRLAAEGVRFNSFYTGCSVCSGSRAALLTGCHYKRVSVPAVMFPGNRNGLHPNEITIAEILKKLGYVTGIIGKWHLGHLSVFLPTRQGFDYYYGIPYSNDMTIDRKNAVFSKDIVFRMGMSAELVRKQKQKRNWVPLMRGEQVIEYPADQSTLTKRYTEEAQQFIQKNKDKRFFLYLPHTFPHVPMFVSKKFNNKKKSLFANVIEELDWSVGEVLKTVKNCGIDKKTMIVFTTDNGTHRGSSGPLRARKASDYEGGYRVPCMVRWPGRVPAGVRTDEVAATIDMLPTLAKIAGGKAPADRIIDGKDISALIFNKQGAKSPHQHYVLAHRRGSVRSGNWKFYPWPEKKGKKQPKTQLYDLSKDLSEKTNVSEQHPEIVAQLRAVFQNHLADLKKNRRPAGTVKK